MPGRRSSSSADPQVRAAYEQLAGGPAAIDLRYDPAWRSRGLGPALAEARADDCGAA